MITLKNLEENYLEAISGHYEFVYDCEEFSLMFTHSYEAFLCFCDCDCHLSSYFMDNDPMMIISKNDKTKFLFIPDENRIKGVNFWSHLASFKENYQQIWDKIYEYYLGTQENQIQSILIYPSMIGNLEEISETVQLEIVKNDPFMIRYIENPYPSVVELYQKLENTHG